MSTSPQDVIPDCPLGDPLSQEDITPYSWVVIVRQTARTEVVFVGMLAESATVLGRTSFHGIGYAPNRTSSSVRWFLTDHGIESDDAPAGDNANTIYLLPPGMVPFDHEEIERWAWVRGLYTEIERLQQAWENGQINTDALTDPRVLLPA